MRELRKLKTHIASSQMDILKGGIAINRQMFNGITNLSAQIVQSEVKQIILKVNI